MSPIILEAHDLTKKYRHTVALDHIDLQIEKGKIYGFIGQNGAGKTTFLRLVTGLAFPTSGTLGLWGKSSAKDLQEQRFRQAAPYRCGGKPSKRNCRNRESGLAA